MGLFSRKSKEYVFSPETGCAVCKQALERDLYNIITYVDETKKQTVLTLRVHHSETCYSMDLIEKMQPAGTEAYVQYGMFLKSVQSIAKKLDF